MAVYRDADISLQHPDGWHLRTIAGFAQSAAYQAPSIVVVREPIRLGDTVHMHAQRKLFTMRAVADFALLESSGVVLGGVPGTRVRYSYSTKDGPIEQSQTFVIAPADRDVVTSFLTTARLVDVEAVRPAFEAALATVRFRVPPTPLGPHPDATAEPHDVPIPGPPPRR